MATKIEKPVVKRYFNKGAWTPEEDQRLSEFIEIHGAKKWKSVAAKAGLNRCEKSCRLRWLNYLRPNIKRGNFTDQEDDLIIRLHKLLGNRWSLIAGRLPGRTDNDIKNYWNSHLSKKMKREKTSRSSFTEEPAESYVTSAQTEQLGSQTTTESVELHEERNLGECFNADEFFNFSNEMGSSGLEWISKFLEQDDDLAGSHDNHGSLSFLGDFNEFDVFYL